MKRLSLFLLLLLPLGATAQTDPAYLAGQRQPTTVTLLPVYQRFDRNDGSDGKISEVSLPLTAYLPLGRQFGVGLRLGRASADADGLASLSGLTDVQVSASTYRRLGRGSVVIALGLNLPTGTQELTLDELETLAFLGQNLYDFHVPTFGRGLGFAPGLTWAHPLSESLVVGVGVTFQYRGAYEPVADMIDTYDPGDEVLLTGGFDARLGPRTTLSADVSYARYATDTIGDAEVYEAGAKTVASVQVRRTRGFNELRFLARYRSSAKNSLAAAGGLVEEDRKTTPTQLEVEGRYRWRVRPRVTLGIRSLARRFAETPVFPETILFGAGLMPALTVSPRVRIIAQVLYLFGDLSGLDAGAGLAVTL